MRLFLALYRFARSHNTHYVKSSEGKFVQLPPFVKLIRNFLSIPLAFFQDRRYIKGITQNNQGETHHATQEKTQEQYPCRTCGICKAREETRRKDRQRAGNLSNGLLEARNQPHHRANPFQSKPPHLLGMDAQQTRNPA